MERIYLCAGSENACKGLEGKPTEDALSGERVHEAMRLHFEKKPEFVPMFASLDEWESKCVETFISKSKVLFESHGGFEPWIWQSVNTNMSHAASRLTDPKLISSRCVRMVPYIALTGNQDAEKWNVPQETYRDRFIYALSHIIAICGKETECGSTFSQWETTAYSPARSMMSRQ
jgi:hypothetical protein